MKKRSFDESFDNIMIVDYDKEYIDSELISADDYVYSDAQSRISLNEKWNFNVDVFDSAIRGRFFEEIITDSTGLPIPYDFSFDDWDEISLPNQWNTIRPEYYLFEGTGLYTRKFQASKDRKKRTFIRIGAANYETRVWLNKKFVGRHAGGFTPFVIDVTEHIHNENRIIIYVNNSRKTFRIPSKNFDWFNYGGITRSIDIFQVPTNYIRSYSLKLVPDGCFNKIEFKAAINCQHLEINSAILVSIEGLGSFSFPVDKSSGSISSVIEAEPELWCPDVPKLYNCEIRLGDHVLRDSIGFREVKVNGNKICLNGKPVFLKGICVHEESCSNRRSVTDDDIIQTINDAKDLGCNFVRLTHYPHTDRFAEIADQMGIMLWEEIPVYWTIDFKNAITKSDAINQLEELIVRDINRASVIIWSVGNETPNTSERLAFMRSLIATARQKDNSRLITASCLIDLDEMVVQDPLIDYLDVIGLNEYYGWYIRDFNKLKKILANTTVDKPLIISETGADAVANKHGRIEELYTEECQANIYRKQFEIIDQTEYICGVSPWILYDYASMRRMSNLQNGFNIKGLITFDRKYKKQAYNVVQNYYRTK